MQSALKMRMLGAAKNQLLSAFVYNNLGFGLTTLFLGEENDSISAQYMECADGAYSYHQKLPLA